jgi:hypothetical protein
VKLNEVTRKTPGKVVLEALDTRPGEPGACSGAKRWVRDTVRDHPRITAQGLWNRCPDGEWMEWLVRTLNDRDFFEDRAEGQGAMYSDYDPFTKAVWDIEYKHNPDSTTQGGLRSAQAIRRAFESPWLCE